MGMDSGVFKEHKEVLQNKKGGRESWPGSDRQESVVALVYMGCIFILSAVAGPWSWVSEHGAVIIAGERLKQADHEFKASVWVA